MLEGDAMLEGGAFLADCALPVGGLLVGALLMASVRRKCRKSLAMIVRVHWLVRMPPRDRFHHIVRLTYLRAQWYSVVRVTTTTYRMRTRMKLWVECLIDEAVG